VARFVYLATVIDCYSKKVAGWSTADHMRTELVAEALGNVAATTLVEPNVMSHSDRGSVTDSRGAGHYGYWIQVSSLEQVCDAVDVSFAAGWMAARSERSGIPHLTYRDIATPNTQLVKAALDQVGVNIRFATLESSHEKRRKLHKSRKNAGIRNRGLALTQKYPLIEDRFQQLLGTRPDYERENFAVQFWMVSHKALCLPPDLVRRSAGLSKCG